MDQRYVNNGALPPVIKNLLIINVLFYVAKEALKYKGINLDLMLGLHYAKSPFFRWWQVVTHFFMHADFFHILFNMFALWMFGRMLELIWGGPRFLFFYAVTAVSAAFLHFLVVNYQINELLTSMDPQKVNLVLSQGADAIRKGENFTNLELRHFNNLYNGGVVGASGAVFGLLGACFILFPNTQLVLLFPPIPIRLKYFVTFYGLYELYRGIANSPSDNVAHFAHLGGLIAGIIIVKYWNKNRRTDFF